MGESQCFISPGTNWEVTENAGRMSGIRPLPASGLRGGDVKQNEFLLSRARLMERSGGNDRKMCMGSSGR